MDSRIREIEQWVDEAKRGLDECGREEYFRKLFLLDAEIRTAIKNSGCVPEAASPQHQVKRVRRFGNPVLKLSGVFGMLLLAATTVYLIRPLNLLLPVMATTGQPAAQADSTYDPQLDRGHIPAAIAGEQIIPYEMLLTAATGTQPQTPSAINSIPELAAASFSGAERQPTLNTGALLGQARPASGKAGKPAANTPAGKRGPAVELLASNVLQPGKSSPAANNTPGGASSSEEMFGGATVSRFATFPEGNAPEPPVNQAKDKASKLAKQGEKNGEIIVEEPVDKPAEDAEENEDKLDAEALKEKLEKRFDR